MTVVSHGFKHERIVDGHCAAIAFPLSRVSYLGIDPPGMMGGDEAAKQDAMAGERRAVNEWKRDPHGRGEALAGKKTRRNVWGVKQTLFETEKENARSGLVTRQLEGGEEVLVDDAIRPWAI
jgi:folylpolyglutamate synthase